MTTPEPKTAETERGTLPDAPLAMPKQVLTTRSGLSWRKLFEARPIKTGS